MTVNAVRRRLRSIRNIRQEIAALDEQIRELRTRAESPGGFSEEFHASAGLVQSKVENCVIKIIELENKLETKRKALVDAELIAEDLLDFLNEKEVTLRAVLRNIYILCNTQEETADLMIYSDRQIRRMEWKAVQKIARRSYKIYQKKTPSPGSSL